MSELHQTNREILSQSLHENPVTNPVKAKGISPNKELEVTKQISLDDRVGSSEANQLMQIVMRLKSEEERGQKVVEDLYQTQLAIKKLSQQVGHLSSKQKTAKTITIKTVKPDAHIPRSSTSIPSSESQATIKALEEQLRKCQTQNAQLKSSLQAEKNLNKELANNLRRQQEKYKKLIYKFDEKVALLNHQIKLYQERIEQLVKELRDIHEVDRSSQFNQTPVYNLIAHNPRNAHQAYYILKKVSSTEAHITHSGPNGYYNFVNKIQILPSHTATYIVKIQKVNSSWILLGFCTSKGLGNSNNYQHSESVYYYCFGRGYLFEGGVKREAEQGSVDGDTIECSADLPNGRIVWKKNKKEVGACSLPRQMEGKKIYFSALTYSKGDQIDLYL